MSRSKSRAPLSPRDQILGDLTHALPANVSVNLTDAAAAAVPVTPALLSAIEQFAKYGSDTEASVSDTQALHRDVLRDVPLLPVLGAVLRAPANERVAETIFTKRSLALYCIGRLVSVNPALKQNIVINFHALIALIVDTLSEKSPFTHNTAFNLLLELSTERQLLRHLTVNHVTLITSVYSINTAITVSRAAAADAQLSVRVMGLALLANIAAIGGVDMLMADSEALGAAIAAMERDTHPDLLIQSLKLLYLMLASEHREQALLSLTNIGYIMALVQHGDAIGNEYIKNAAKVVLAQTPLGARAASGQSITHRDLTVEELAVYDTRLKQLNTAAGVTAPPAIDAKVSTGDHRACGQCGQSEARSPSRFAACAQCKAVYYCSKDCQVKDWKSRHKQQCARAVR